MKVEPEKPTTGPIDGRTVVVLAALVLLAGIALRAYVLGTELGQPDLDEATVAVQAEQFRDGHLAVFFPNQAYGGTLETAVVALAFTAFGTSTLVLKTVPLLLTVAATYLTWRAAHRLIDSRTGRWAVPALMWCWPASSVLQSLKERGFYGVALVLSAAVVLLVLRLADDPADRRDLVLLGVCLGLGWWSTPLSVLVALPACAWLVVHRREVLAGARVVAVAAFASALPWFVGNLRSGFDSLSSPSAFGTTWGGRTGDFLNKLPLVAGFETPWDADRRLLPWRLVLQLVVVAVVAVASARTWRRAPGLLPVIVVGYGLLYGANSLVAGVGADPRYLYPLTPVLALCVGALLRDPPVPAAAEAGDAAATRPREPHLVDGHVAGHEVRAVLAVTAAAVCLSVWGLVGTRAEAREPDPDKFLSSDGIGRVTALLEEREVVTALTDVAGSQITYLSGGRVVAGSFVVPRFPDAERGARADPTSTYVLDAELYGNARRLDRWLDAHDVHAERHRIGRWRVFLLNTRVLPDDAGLGEAFGLVPPMPAEHG